LTITALSRRQKVALAIDKSWPSFFHRRSLQTTFSHVGPYEHCQEYVVKQNLDFSLHLPPFRWQKRRKSYHEQDRYGEESISEEEAEQEEDDQRDKEDDREYSKGGESEDTVDEDDWANGDRYRKWNTEKENKAENREKIEPSSLSSTNKTTTGTEWRTSLSTTSTKETSYSSTSLETQHSSTSLDLTPTATLPSIPSIGLPFTQPTLTPQRATLITDQLVKAKQRALEASRIGATSSETSLATLSWISPRPGDAFAAGDQITLGWNTPSPSLLTFQLRLCVLRTSMDLKGAQSGSFSDGSCGLAVNANSTLASDSGGWSVSL